MHILNILTALLPLASAGAMPGASKANGKTAPNNTLVAQPGLIPYSEIDCWNERLNPDELEVAKKKLVEWGYIHGHYVDGATGKYFGDTAVWICSCKYFRKDHILKIELDEAQELLYRKCGLNQTGTVYSRPWHKSFNFGKTTQWLHHYQYRVCRHMCVRDVGDPHGDDHGTE